MFKPRFADVIIIKHSICHFVWSNEIIYTEKYSLKHSPSYIKRATQNFDLKFFKVILADLISMWLTKNVMSFENEIPQTSLNISMQIQI